MSKIVTRSEEYLLHSAAHKIIAYSLCDEMKHYKENPNNNHMMLHIIELAIRTDYRTLAATMLHDLNEMANHYDDYGWNDIDKQNWKTKNAKDDFEKTRHNLVRYFDPEIRDEDIEVCQHCGSKDITMTTYFNINNNEIEDCNDGEDMYCDDCGDETYLMSLKAWKDKAYGKQSKNT